MRSIATNQESTEIQDFSQKLFICSAYIIGSTLALGSNPCGGEKISFFAFELLSHDCRLPCT